MSVLDIFKGRFSDGSSQLPKRQRWRYEGATISDDPVAGETVITITAGVGGSSGTSVTIANQANGQITSAALDAAVALYQTGTGALTTTGLRAKPSGGQLRMLLGNRRTGDWTIKHLDGGAPAANQVACPDNVDFVIRTGETAEVYFDQAANRYALTGVVAQRAARAATLDGVATIAALRALRPVQDGTIARTLGWASRGDLGAIEAYWDASATVADNGVTVFGDGVSATGRWRRLNPRGEWLLPTFGALPGTNCAALINNAIAVLSVDVGAVAFGEICFVAPRAPSPYLLETSVVGVSNLALLKFRGDGHFTTANTYCGSAQWTSGDGRPRGSVFQLAAGVDGFRGASGAYSYFHFEDLAIVGSGYTSGEGIRLSASGGQISCYRVGIFNCRVGLHMEYAVTCRNLDSLKIRGCWQGVLWDAGTDTFTIGIETQNCNYGQVFRSTYNIWQLGMLVQGCIEGIRFGWAEGDAYSDIALCFQHFELNGIGSSAKDAVNCDCATTANITLSGVQTIDGVAGAVNRKVLVKNQTDTTQNSVYLMQSGAWTRASHSAGFTTTFRGAFHSVSGGSQAGQTFKVDDSAGPAPADGTAAITIAQVTEGYDLRWRNDAASANNVQLFMSRFGGGTVTRPYGVVGFHQCNVAGTALDESYNPSIDDESGGWASVAPSVNAAVMRRQMNGRQLVGSQQIYSGSTSGTHQANGTVDGSHIHLVLTGNVTIDFPTGYPQGYELTYVFTQDGTGGRVVTFTAGIGGLSSATSGTAAQRRVVVITYSAGSWFKKSDTGWYTN